MTTAHRVTHTTPAGAREVLRVFGAPDCDMAAMRVADRFGGTVHSADAIDADAPHAWGELDLDVAA